MLRQIAPVFFTLDIPATLAYYTGKLGFACLGTWQDPPVYAIVARPAGDSFPLRRAAHSQFVRVFVRIGCGRLGATEMNHLLVAPRWRRPADPATSPDMRNQACLCNRRALRE